MFFISFNQPFYRCLFLSHHRRDMFRERKHLIFEPEIQI
jgi:hypothetical protein